MTFQSFPPFFCWVIRGEGLEWISLFMAHKTSLDSLPTNPIRSLFQPLHHVFRIYGT